MVCQRRDRMMCQLRRAIYALLALVCTGVADAEEAKHLGVATCASSVCHGRVEMSEKHQALMTEYSTWFRHDPHSRAFETLKSPLSQRIARNLGIADASQSDQCLDCHTDNVEPAKRVEEFHLGDGVGCESCHGGAEHWISEHYRDGVTYADNVALGMRDLVDPFNRAKVCADCHIGSDDRIASHRIMAAGHPRLRFELATYQAIMPAHHVEDEAYQQRKSPPGPVSLWAAGVQVSALRYLELLVGKHMNTGGPFPEFALFDCYSCHKSIPSGEGAGYPSTTARGLGLPALVTANLSLFEVLLATSGSQHFDRYSLALKKLQSANGLQNGQYKALSKTLMATLANTTTISDESRYLAKLLPSLINVDRARSFTDYIGAELYFMSLDSLVRAHNSPEFPPARLDPLYRTFAGADEFQHWLFLREVRRLTKKLPALE